MSLSAKTHTTGDGISKTTTDTTTDRTASAHHGTGADITVRSTVLITAHTTTITGTVGDIITLGAATAITILGTTEDTMADSTILGTMTHGITEDTGEDTGENTTAITDIWDGMTHGTTTITDGIILTTVRRTLWEVLTSNLVITDSVRIQREDRSHQAIRQDLQ